MVMKMYPEGLHDLICEALDRGFDNPNDFIYPKEESVTSTDSTAVEIIAFEAGVISTPEVVELDAA